MKRSASSLTKDELFVDPFFDPETLNISSKEKIVWLRPRDLVEKPRLGTRATNYKDVLQGRLDNCAFVSACSSIANCPELMNQVDFRIFFFVLISKSFWFGANFFVQIFEDDIKLNDETYRGFVTLNLWLNNKWTKLIIDDRLPTLNNELVFAKCKNKNHFWVPLLEKAFAK